MYIEPKLYEQIQKSMPIPCVDLVIMDSSSRILLLKRKNEPVAGQWWFPGGRVHFKESRTQAAARKAREECGLKFDEKSFRELGTYDVILDRESGQPPSHGISTVFQVKIGSNRPLTVLDQQSQEAQWRSVEEWKKETLHPFIEKIVCNE